MIKILLASFLLIFTASCLSEVSGKPNDLDWSNPVVALRYDLFRAITPVFEEFQKSKEKSDIFGYDILAGHGRDGIYVFIRERLSRQKPYPDYKNTFNYWVNISSLAISKSGHNKPWSNVDVVVPLDLFCAAYNAYKNAIKRFSASEINGRDIVIGRGKIGITVEFLINFSESNVAVMGGDSIDYWIDDKTFKVVSVNYSK